MTPPFAVTKDIAGPNTGPLAAYVEPYVTLIQRLGYRRATIRLHLRLIGGLNRWLVRTRRDLANLDECVLTRFLKDRFGGKPSPSGAPPTLRRLLGLIRAAGDAPPEKSLSRPSPAECLLERYRRYMFAELGLAPTTVAGYTWYIRRFLRARYGAGQIDLPRLHAKGVIRFIRRVALGSGIRHTQLHVAAWRSFLRFLYHQGLIKTDFAPAIPSIPHWTLASLPKHISADAVQRVLNRCERNTPLQRRNYAILLLLARLGLRGGEVIRLNLEDIDWDAARITIRATKGPGWAQLPLPADAAQAIAQYLRRDRPSCPSRRVFLRARAPHTGVLTITAVSLAVRTALKNAGVTAPRIGAHLFRHSLATSMLRQGASLEEIGQLLRHRSPNTTAVYAKVDVKALRPLALSWPGGAR